MQGIIDHKLVFFNIIYFYHLSLRNYALMLRIYDQQVTWINSKQM
jgi:hypothetical protein